MAQPYQYTHIYGPAIGTGNNDPLVQPRVSLSRLPDTLVCSDFRKGGDSVIPPSFDYHAPENLEEASRLLLANPEAKLLAGGHSLIPMMRFRLAEPTALVDLRRIPGLSGIREAGGSLCIGAMTRESELDKSELVRSRYPLLADTTRVIADPVVRNLATIGGNVAHADPGNDHPATMLAYRASFVASGPSGQRTVVASDFFTGPFSTCLEAGEILTEIRIPAFRAGAGGAYQKFERKVGDYAVAAVAVQLQLAGGRIASAGVALTNVGLTAIQADAAEAALVGSDGRDAALDAAAAAAAGAADPGDDHRGSADYKRAVVRTLTYRAAASALARAKEAS